MTVFDNLANNSSNLSFIVEDERRFTYNDLLNDADYFGKGIKKRSLIFIISSNNYDCVAGYVGALRANAVIALINESVRESILNDLVINFKPSFIYQPKNLFQCEKVMEQKFKFGKYVLYETNLEIDYEINGDLSLLLMTSGSTGSPEFVRLSHSNIYSNTQAICQYLNIDDTDKAITTLPLSYSYGISIVNTHLFMGASLVLTDSSIVEKSFWDLVSNNEVTTFSGVPYTYDILKKLNFMNIDLPSLKYITQAGGKLSLGLLEYYHRVCTQKNIDFIVMYGQTEASPRMSYLPSKMMKNKLGSIGVPIPGGRFYLIDGNKKIINETDVEGELVYEGENVCLGYARNCYDLASGDSNKGVLETGDMAKVDSDGYYYITGRKKRFLKLFGNRVSLDQVEQKINEAGYKCACVGVDDQMMIYTDKRSNLENIIEFIERHFDINKSGFSVICIDEIPRNHSGKILYSELGKN